MQIDIDGAMLSLRYPMEVNLIGDSTETLRALLPLLQQKTDRVWRRDVEKNVADMVEDPGRRARWQRRSGQPATRLLGTFAAPAGTCIMTGDSGSFANWYARDMRSGAA